VSGRTPNKHDEWHNASGQPPPGPALWVYLVILVYCGLVSLIVFGLPLYMIFVSDDNGWAAACIFSAAFAALGASLLIIPIGNLWDLPRAKRSIVIPLLGSATIAALLFAGFSIASYEFLEGNIPNEAHEVLGRVLLYSIPVVWVGWLVIFAQMASSVDRLSLSSRMYKWLLAGSVLELLVAIAMHMVVRRRAECCAGIGTGIGIGVGLTVMLIALGPAVFFLFYRRYKQVYDHHNSRAES